MKFHSNIRFFLIIAVILLAFMAIVLQAQDSDDEMSGLGIDYLSIQLGHGADEEMDEEEMMAPEFLGIDVSMTMEEAEEEGLIAISPCVPAMGYHVASMGEAGPDSPVLMYDASGTMIGMEFLSFTEQPAPIWGYHVESEELAFWTLHIYWSDNVEGACDEM